MINWDKVLISLCIIICIIAIMEFYYRLKLKIAIKQSQKKVWKKIMQEINDKKRCEKKNCKTCGTQNGYCVYIKGENENNK